MLVFIGSEYVKLCENIELYEEAKTTRKHIQTMKDTVLKYGYDGEWFLRAYDDFGSKVGSSENEEGKIFIETQGFCVMAAIGLETGEARKALDSAWKYLDTKHGMVLLNPCIYKISCRAR